MSENFNYRMCISNRTLPHVREKIEKPTACEIHKTMINFVPSPSITQNTYPALKWNNIWRNIISNELSSKQRTLYYLLVNEKNNIQDKKFKHNYKSVNSPNCSFCGITETLEQKFKNCRQLEGYWCCVRTNET